MWLLFQNMVSLRASTPSCEKSRESSTLSRVLSLLTLPVINGELARGQSCGLDYGRVFYKRTGLMICKQGLNVGFSERSHFISERKKITEKFKKWNLH